jgi:hypothetical protein
MGKGKSLQIFIGGTVSLINQWRKVSHSLTLFKETRRRSLPFFLC